MIRLWWALNARAVPFIMGTVLHNSVEPADLLSWSGSVYTGMLADVEVLESVSREVKPKIRMQNNGRMKTYLKMRRAL